MKSAEGLLNSKKRLDKLYRLKKRVTYAKVLKPSERFRKRLLDALKDDLNISVALDVVDKVINKGNRWLDSSKGGNVLLEGRIAGNIAFIDEVLGIGGDNALKYFERDLCSAIKFKVHSLIRQRDAARLNSDYVKADSIRNELLELGVTISDTPNGTVWEKI